MKWSGRSVRRPLHFIRRQSDPNQRSTRVSMGARLDRASRSARRMLPLALLVVLGLALYAGLGFGLARHDRPAAPAITASPPEVSRNRTPSFTFTDPDA